MSSSIYYCKYEFIDDININNIKINYKDNKINYLQYLFYLFFQFHLLNYLYDINIKYYFLTIIYYLYIM